MRRFITLLFAVFSIVVVEAQEVVTASQIDERASKELYTGEALCATEAPTLLQALVVVCPSFRYVNGEVLFRVNETTHPLSSVLILCDDEEITNINAVNLASVSSVEIFKDTKMYGFRGVGDRYNEQLGRGVKGVIVVKTLK